MIIDWSYPLTYWQSKLCDSCCPAGTVFLTQNSHPAGDRTDCAHGSYISVCCDDLVSTAEFCPNEPLYDSLLSGGISGSGSSDNAYVFISPVNNAKKRDEAGVLIPYEVAKRDPGHVDKYAISKGGHAHRLQKRYDDGYNPGMVLS